MLNVFTIGEAVEASKVNENFDGILNFLYGDGSDGDVVLTNELNTLSRDMYYDNLTINEVSTSGAYNPASALAGYATRTTDGAWATIIAGAGTAVAHTSIAVRIQATTSADVWSEVRRGLLAFNTSALPDSAVITSATLQLYVTAVVDQLDQSLSLVKGKNIGASIDTFDFSSLDKTKCASDIDLGSLSVNAYNTFTLNADGLANISKTASTYFALLMSGDADNSEPTWASGADSSVTAQEETGANPPILTVNYTYSAQLNPSGYRIFVKDTLTINGLIERNGNSGTVGATATGLTGATAGTAGTGLSAGTLRGSNTAGASTNGGNGGSNSNGVSAGNAAAGTNVNYAFNVAGKSGTTGGQGGSTGGGSGGTGGGAGTQTTVQAPRSHYNIFSLFHTTPTINEMLWGSSGNGGSGGGGGGIGSSGQGGGGGGGGGGASSAGIIVIFAKTIIVNGTIKAIGGSGGNGGNGATGISGNSGGGGGGAGGSGANGGAILIVCNTITGEANLDVSGGTAGDAGVGAYGVGTRAATKSSDGSAGNAGSDGTIIILKR